MYSHIGALPETIINTLTITPINTHTHAYVLIQFFMSVDTLISTPVATLINTDAKTNVETMITARSIMTINEDEDQIKPYGSWFLAELECHKQQGRPLVITVLATLHKTCLEEVLFIAVI